MKKFFKENWSLLLILLTGFVLRFYKLASLPPGLHPDEAANGLDIISMFEGGKFQAIYDTNGPREALFFYLQAIPLALGHYFKIAILNYTPLALRIAPAAIGVATIWAIYLLGKELKNKNFGLLAAAAMSVSAWHIQFSRNGFRAIMAPLALCLTFYFFLKAYKKTELRDFVGFGISLAVGFYTYLSFRMVPLVLMALLGFILVKKRDFIKENFKKLLVAGGVFLVLMIPMFIHFYYVPADIAGRSSTSIFNPELNNGSPIKTLGDNIVKTALMFNFEGDGNFRHNLGKSPMLDPVMGILVWIGLAVLLFHLLEIEYFLLLMWLGALSLPELLTAEGIPHALRLVGIMPVVYFLVALGVYFILERINKEKLAEKAALVLLLIGSFFGVKKYFIDFPALGEAGEAYAEDMVGIANDINQGGAERRNILIVGDYGTKTIQFITHSTKIPYERYEVRDFEDQLRLSGEYKIFIQKDWGGQAKRKLEEKYGINNVRPVHSKIDGRTIYYEYQAD